MYHGRDTYAWRQQINSKDFKQSCCFPPDRPVIMMKATTTVRAPIDVLVDCAIDFEVRQKWYNVLYDFKVFEMSKDRTRARVSYCFRSPAPPVADRDFYL